jgi:orotate phosphoribosyltransferase
VKDGIAVPDRQQGGQEEPARHGFRLDTLTDLEPALDADRKSGQIAEADLQSARSYLDSAR